MIFEERERNYWARIEALQDLVNRLMEQLTTNYALTVPTYVITTLPEEKVRDVLKRMQVLPRFTQEEIEALTVAKLCMTEESDRVNIEESIATVRKMLEE